MAVIDRFEIGGIFYDVQDTAATNKNTQQDAEIGSLQTRVSAVEQEARKPNAYTELTPRVFVTATSAYTYTVPADGFLKVHVAKKEANYTVFLGKGAQTLDSISYFGDSSGGAPLSFPSFSGTLSAWVKRGDQITIYSNEPGAPTGNSWYVMSIGFQYAG